MKNLLAASGRRVLLTGAIALAAMCLPRLANAQEINVTPTTVPFGTVDVGASQQDSFVIENQQGGPNSLTVSAITKAAVADCDAFTLDTAAPPDLVIGPNSSHTVNVTFAPTAVGAHSCEVTIESDDANEGTVLVTLTGTGEAPDINVTPGMLTFGQREIGTSTILPVTIQNTASVATLDVDDLTLSGDGEFTFSDPGTLSIPPGMDQDVPITFSPTTAGTYTATLTISSDDPDEDPVMVMITGEGVAPDINVTPNPLAFNQRVVGSSTMLSVTIQNTAAAVATLDVDDLTLSGDGEFTFTDPGTLSIPPGMQQQVPITFSPNAVGTYTATLRINSDDPDEASVDVSITGEGIAPDIAVSPGSIDFGNTVTASAPRMVVATNNGNAPLNIMAATLSNAADFDLSGPMMTTVQPGMTTMWSVTCTPSTLGPLSGTLTIVSDDPDSPSEVVNLDCVGVDRALLVSPDPVQFPDVYVGDTATPITLTLTNNQTTVPLTIMSVSVLDPLIFPLTNVPPPEIMLAGDESNATITIGFAPTARVAYMDTITIVTDQGMFTIDVEGEGVEAELAITAPPDPMPVVLFDFGEELAGQQTTPQTFQFENVGTAPFSISSVTIDDTTNFQLNVGTGTGPMAPGQIRTIQIAARPMNVGAITATVTVTHDIPNVPPTSTFEVRVTGTLADVEISDPVLAFGDVDVQNPAAVQRMVTLTNNGNGPFTIANTSIPAGTPYTVISAPMNGTLVGPGAMAEFIVEYLPGLEGLDTETMTIETPDLLGSTTITIGLDGRGIDRHISVPGELAFEDTFVYPDEPTESILTIENTGDAELIITDMMIDNPAYSIREPIPTRVLPQGSEEVVLEFSPDATVNFNGTLTIVNDDDEIPMAEISLNGLGKRPNIAVDPVGPLEIYTSVGVPARLSDVDLGMQQMLLVTNMEPEASFTVADIRVSDLNGDPVDPAQSPFRIIGFDGETRLGPEEQIEFDLEFTPTEPGTFFVRVELYVGQNPEETEAVTVTGFALDVDLRGGGGCACDTGASGNDLGSMWAMLLMVLAVLGHRSRRLRRALSTLICLAAITMLGGGAAAHADVTSNFDLTTFRPAPGVENNMLTVENPHIGKSGAWSVSVALNRATDPLRVDPVGIMREPDQPVTSRTATDVMFSYAFGKRFETGVLIPILQQTGEDPTFSNVPAANGTALGAVSVHGKAALVELGGLALAGSAAVTLPTAMDGHYAGRRFPSLHARSIAGVRLREYNVNVAVNAGFRWRATSSFGDVEQGSEVTYGVATEYRLLEQLSALGEVFGAVPIGAGESAAVNPLEAVLGLRFRPFRQIGVATGIGRGLASGVGTPAFRAFFQISFSPRARDILELGPPIDRGDDDGDGVINSYDDCRDTSEDLDGFADRDGCPDLDNDGDGLPDDQDECPTDAEDIDKFNDGDGCPDRDNDNDGIADESDQCPSEAEDIDKFDDGDGCPEPDNDRDGILDGVDQCVDKPETINGNKDEDGCPDEGDALVMVMVDRLEIFEAVRFRGNTSRLLRSSDRVLQQVAATLRAYAEFSRVRIAVHVHPVNAKDEARSIRRAEAVKRWLVKQGIAEHRLDVRGYGSSRPLVPKGQKGARQVNDRVEFIILEKEISSRPRSKVKPSKKRKSKKRSKKRRKKRKKR